MLIQYLSLNWPADSGWAAYNGLQLIAYFITVFVAAPLALITGLGMSPALSTRFRRISKTFSIQTARSLHFLVLVWFVVFIVIHVTLVFTTGLLVNLNHVYAGRNDHSWIGFWLFAASMVVVVLGWVAATPFTIHHPRVVQRAGQAHRRPAPTPLRAPRSQTRPVQRDGTSRRTSGTTGSTRTPTSTRPSSTASSRTTGCGSTDSSNNPVELDLTQLRALPHHEQITQHFCIQGWSGIAKWGGVSMQTLLDLVKPHPDAKWVVFYSLGEGADKGVYYDAHPIEHMSHHLTMLAYDMNGYPLSFGHGAPLRLRNEIELGFKQVKWIKGMEFVADYGRHRRRLRRIQPGSRILRLPPVDLTLRVPIAARAGGVWPATRPAPRIRRRTPAPPAASRWHR